MWEMGLMVRMRLTVRLFLVVLLLPSSEGGWGEVQGGDRGPVIMIPPGNHELNSEKLHEEL